MCLARKGLWSQKANSSWRQYLQFLWDMWPSIAQEMAFPFQIRPGFQQRKFSFLWWCTAVEWNEIVIRHPFFPCIPLHQCCWWSWVLCWLHPYLVGCKPISRHLAQPDHKWALWNCACHLRLLQLPDFAKKTTTTRKRNLDATVLSLYVDCFDKSVYIFFDILTIVFSIFVLLFAFVHFPYFIFKYSGQECLQV